MYICFNCLCDVKMYFSTTYLIIINIPLDNPSNWQVALIGLAATVTLKTVNIILFIIYLFLLQMLFTGVSYGMKNKADLLFVLITKTLKKLIAGPHRTSM